MEERPTTEQVAWVFRRLCEHLQDEGTFRALIYNRMGFKTSDYITLHEAGGMALSNALFDARTLSGLLPHLRELIKRDDLPAEMKEALYEALESGAGALLPEAL